MLLVSFFSPVVRGGRCACNVRIHLLFGLLFIRESSIQACFEQSEGSDVKNRRDRPSDIFLPLSWPLYHLSLSNGGAVCVGLQERLPVDTAIYFKSVVHDPPSLWHPSLRDACCTQKTNDLFRALFKLILCCLETLSRSSCWSRGLLKMCRIIDEGREGGGGCCDNDSNS